MSICVEGNARKLIALIVLIDLYLTLECKIYYNKDDCFFWFVFCFGVGVRDLMRKVVVEEKGKN